jgi:hypothetical protein
LAETREKRRRIEFHNTESSTEQEQLMDKNNEWTVVLDNEASVIYLVLVESN